MEGGKRLGRTPLRVRREVVGRRERGWKAQSRGSVLPLRNRCPPVFYAAQFLVDILEMELDRIETDMKNHGDFPVGLSFRDPAHDFFFPIREGQGLGSRLSMSPP